MTIWVLASGQSNCLGRNPGGPSAATVPSLVKVWNNVNPLGSDGDNFITPVLGTAPFDETEPRNNPALSFCWRLAEETGEDVRLALVAQGGASITEWSDNDPNEDGSPMYDEIASVHAAIEAYVGSAVEFDVLFWHQGEANSGVAASTYNSYFENWIDRARANNILASDAPLLIGGIADNPDVPNRATFNAARESYCRANPLAVFAPAYGLETDDGTHFTGQETHRLGYERYWYAYAQAFEIEGGGVYAPVNAEGYPSVPDSGSSKIFNIRPLVNRLDRSECIESGIVTIASIPVEFERYANGVQVVRARLNLFYSNTRRMRKTFNFPAAFLSDTNYVVSGSIDWDESTVATVVQYEALAPIRTAATATSCLVDVYAVDPAAWDAADELVVYVRAEGKWR